MSIKSDENVISSFVNFLLNGEFSNAHSLLSDSIKQDISPMELKDKFDSFLIEEGTKPFEFFGVMETLDKYPKLKNFLTLLSFIH